MERASFSGLSTSKGFEICDDTNNITVKTNGFDYKKPEMSLWEGCSVALVILGIFWYIMEYFFFVIKMMGVVLLPIIVALKNYFFLDLNHASIGVFVLYLLVLLFLCNIYFFVSMMVFMQLSAAIYLGIEFVRYVLKRRRTRAYIKKFFIEHERSSQYHACEHKLVNLLEKWKPVSLKSLQEETPIHKDCGTNFFFGFFSCQKEHLSEPTDEQYQETLEVAGEYFKKLKEKGEER